MRDEQSHQRAWRMPVTTRCVNTARHEPAGSESARLRADLLVAGTQTNQTATHCQATEVMQLPLHIKPPVIRLKRVPADPQRLQAAGCCGGKGNGGCQLGVAGQVQAAMGGKSGMHQASCKARLHTHVHPNARRANAQGSPRVRDFRTGLAFMFAPARRYCSTQHSLRACSQGQQPSGSASSHLFSLDR